VVGWVLTSWRRGRKGRFIEPYIFPGDVVFRFVASQDFPTTSMATDVLV
jgi:hypothetical protein